MLLGPRFEAALVYAAQLHARQLRKAGNIPYVAHLLAVTGMVLEHGGDEDTAIAALLHDSVEDQGGEPTLAEVRRRFGERVAGIVHACSDSLSDNPAEKRPWLERKRRYVAHLAHADADARLVSAADKLHNARCVLGDLRQHGAVVWDRFRGGREGSLWYYDAVATALRAQGDTPLVQELDRVVDELAAAAGMTRPAPEPERL